MEPIKLNDFVLEDKPMHVLIYGLAGCGKTDLLSSFPKPMAVIDLDGKYQPLVGKGEIDLYPFHMRDANDAKAMIPQIWSTWQQLKKDPKYASIGFDSITALDRMLDRYVVKVKGKQDNEQTTRQEYGDMRRWYRTFFPSLQGATDKNIIILAHEQSKEDDKGNMINIRPFITGKMGDELASIFEHTFHMKYVGGANERWELRYKQQGLYTAASCIFSGGDGVITYKRDESGYDAIIKRIREVKK